MDSVCVHSDFLQLAEHISIWKQPGLLTKPIQSLFKEIFDWSVKIVQYCRLECLEMRLDPPSWNMSLFIMSEREREELGRKCSFQAFDINLSYYCAGMCRRIHACSFREFNCSPRSGAHSHSYLRLTIAPRSSAVESEPGRKKCDDNPEKKHVFAAPLSLGREA